MDRQDWVVSRRRVLRAGLVALGAGAGLRGALCTLGSDDALAASHPPARPRVTAGDRAAVARLAEATRPFGFDLFARLVAASPGTNVLVSPSSIATALTMVYNGAGGATAQAMAHVLGVQGMSVAALNRANAALIALLSGLDPHVRVTVADALWVRQGIALRPPFVAAVSASYGAHVASLDFGTPRAAHTINGWVNGATEGHISAIVPERIDAHAILYLVNAVYFHGAWSTPFEKRLTQPYPFTPAHGPRRTVPLMTGTGTYPYYQGATFQAVALPYGAGHWSMYVFLPDERSSLGALLNTLSATTWASWLANLRPEYGTIGLPRFTVGYGVSLNSALVAQGMGIAYDRQRADFSAMIANPDVQRPHISTVDHAALMMVDEQGTTAAAATSVGVVRATAVRAGFTMTVDRPFLCAIRDNTTGTVLFIGAIADPR